jgi:hypothetical protein
MTWFNYMIVDFKNFLASLKCTGLDPIVSQTYENGSMEL